MMPRIVFFDLETGGLDPDRHPIIQIAAVAVDASTFDEMDSFERKLRFKLAAATSEALEMNSYDAEIWTRDAIEPPDVFADFADFLREHATRPMVSKAGKPWKAADLAGHNVAAFDMRFLWRYVAILRECGAGIFLPFFPIPLDTLQLARWWQKITDARLENLKLGTLCKHLDIDLDDAHDALSDVRATARVAEAIMADFKGPNPEVP